MRKDLVDITVVLDRSGSMRSCKEDSEGGFNSFIQKQKEETGETNLTLIQFDDEYEVVYNGINIQNVKEYKLEPRGMTALLDAVGKAINVTGSRLAAMKEEDRPATVLFMIITDGGENSSTEFTGEQIKSMIEIQQNIYKWKFTYLGANVDAFAVGGSLGIKTSGLSNYNTRNTRSVYNTVSNLTSRMRESAIKGDDVDLSYTSDEIEAMNQ